jgi:small subunit ribosomal protein S18
MATKSAPRRNRNQNQNRSDPRLKQCAFCEKEVPYVDYKDYPTLKPYIDYFGNIRAKYYTGVCLRHQKMLRHAIELARFMAMLSYRK